MNKLKPSKNVLEFIHQIERNSLLKRLNSNINRTKEQTIDDRKKIWLNLLYLDDKAHHW